MSNLEVVFWTAPIAALISAATITQLRQDAERRFELGLHNEFCAKGDRRGGGRLVRGQDGSYVCIDPRSVKWERR